MYFNASLAPKPASALVDAQAGLGYRSPHKSFIASQALNACRFGCLAQMLQLLQVLNRVLVAAHAGLGTDVYF